MCFISIYTEVLILFFVFKKQTIYNCIFTIGLLLSTVSAFEIFTSNTISPVSGTPLTGKIVVIDAGHGTPDSGATGFSGSKEKDFNLDIAKKTGNILQKCGAYVVYTRENDSTIADNLDDSIRNIKKNDMAKRKDIRDSSDADVFISIHMNIFSDSKYRGAQVFYSADHLESKKLAQNIQSSLKKYVDPSNKRNIKQGDKSIFILKRTTIPSVLIECGFISNPEEEKKLLSNTYKQDIAYAISCGIIKYLSKT